MKRIIITTLFVALSAFFASSVHAQSDTGNPVGAVDSVTCSTASGWTYDPDYTPPVVYGCTDSTASNFNINATNDDGSCVFPQATCVSRYRWVNINAGSVDPSQGCAAVGATPAGSCASGEDRPSSGYGVAQINYSRGIWGGGNGGGGTLTPFANGGYRCYQSGQKQDQDNTDVAVAYYCDFGSQYSNFCPADNPPAPPRSSGGSGCFTSETSITMADGSSKPVSSLVSGDMVRGETSDNSVTGVKHVLLGDRPLYSINGSKAFVTAGHPFKTTDGWKSVDPAETVREGVDISVSQLTVGDSMITADGSVLVASIAPQAGDSSTVLYNPMLDGDHTYYANGFLVHNKVNPRDNQQLNVGPKSFFEALVNLFRPLMAIAASSDSNTVLIYNDSGALLAEVPANIYRGDVNSVMGISGNHGFSWDIPQSLRDNNSHTLYFFGTNTDGAGKDSELGGSPATIQCAPPVNNSPSSPSLSCPANGSYTDTNLQLAFTSSDAEGNGVRYLVDWDNDGTVDQIVPGGFAPSGSQQSAYRSWSTPGPKTVSVSAEDDQGAVSSGTSCSFNLAPLPPEPPTTCQDTNANNYGGSLPCTYPQPTCQDLSANNYGGTLPCTYDVCQDTAATNFGGTLPCTYPPSTFSVSIRSSTNTVAIPYPQTSERITIFSGTTVPAGTTLTQHGLEYNFNNEGWTNAGAWNDLIPNTERQTNASFPPTTISSAGTHAFRAYGSNNGGATYFYTSPVTITATKDLGPGDPTFCQLHPSDPSCTSGPGPGGGSGPGGNGPGSINFCNANPSDPSCGPGSSFCIANPSSPACSGFTVTSNESNIAPIQFLGSLTSTSSPATSTARRIEVNPVSGFSSPVTLQVAGISSKASGAPLPEGVSANYSFDNSGSTATLTWNDTFGRYVTSHGIGSVFQASFSGAIPGAYNVTIRGTSVNNPSMTSDYILTIDPSAVNPLFREI